MEESWNLVLQTPQLQFAIIIYFSAIVGSFLNVVIYRLPIMMKRKVDEALYEAYPDYFTTPPSEHFNLCLPRSACPKCGSQISALYNIPILSWLILRGKAACCRNPISPRYPLVEFSAVLWGIAVLALFGPTWYMLGVLLLGYLLICMGLIGWDKQSLPDALTFSVLWGGILLHWFELGPISLSESVMGAVLGYFIAATLHWVAGKLTHNQLLTGSDDLKLIAGLAAWVGSGLVVNLILVAILLDIALRGVRLMLHKKVTQYQPFGPSIIVAGLAVLIYLNN